jgi:hypothetical protein
MSLFAVRCFQVFLRGIDTGKLTRYKIDGSKYCVKKEYNSMKTMPRMRKHP